MYGLTDFSLITMALLGFLSILGTSSVSGLFVAVLAAFSDVRLAADVAVDFVREGTVMLYGLEEFRLSEHRGQSSPYVETA